MQEQWMGVMISYRSWDDQALGKVLEELERGCRARERMSRSMQTCGVETQARKWEGAGRSGFWRQMDKTRDLQTSLGRVWKGGM